jgi:hypothetical protein
VFHAAAAAQSIPQKPKPPRGTRMGDSGSGTSIEWNAHAYGESMMPNDTALLDPVAKAIGRLDRNRGPVRILRDVHGRTEAPKVMCVPWTAVCHWVLVRQDGFTIGGPRDLYEAAKELWPRQWVAVICYANTPHRITIRFPG